MVVGDGAIVRAGLDALLQLLRNFAAPTGERGSILLMSGGLIVLGFLFLAFLFRSAIVGDLAPVANARAPTPRALLPQATAAVMPSASAVSQRLPRKAFDKGREDGGKVEPTIDAALDALRAHGVDARVLRSNGTWKRIRLYRCLTCAHERASGAGCEYERGFLAGAFERITGDLAKVQEVACAADGAPHCELEVRHAPLLMEVA